jgi:hypothetical protein
MKVFLFYLHPRCNIFMWLCMHNAIPTNKLRHHCNLATSPVCQRCGKYKEDVLHCLRDCAPSKEVWQLISSVNHRYLFSFTSWKTWLQTMSKGAFGNMFAITIWWIWRFRNNHILGDKQWKTQNVIHFIDIMCTDLTSLNIHSSEHHINRHMVNWTPPPDGCVKLNIDGSCGASGDIGSGGLLRDNKGNWIAGFSSNDGQGDELFAVLFGVYHGLMLVISNSIQQVTCETDSLEVFRLLQDPDHSHMHVYASLLVKIFGLKEHIRNISFQHVLREGNHCANSWPSSRALQD